jgi:hypothetical protein
MCSVRALALSRAEALDEGVLEQRALRLVMRLQPCCRAMGGELRDGDGPGRA